ncbi:MAG: VTT domain-containing protein [Acutalibacteraceae bacterium]|nr:VTT domain-containing protein [Acutalibacteraceae bacterium]
MITEKQKKTISLCVIVTFILFCAAVGWFIGRPMIQFVSDPEKFRNWVNESGIWGRICFVLMVMFQVIVAFVPGEPLEIGAGYAFGTFEGTLLCIVGITLGSIIVFELVRKFGIKLVEVFFTFEKIKSAKFLQDEKKLALITFLMFFLPGTPKDLLTYVLGLSKVKRTDLLILAGVARLPSIITSTVGGSLLGTEKYLFAVIVFGITFLISAAGWIIYNRKTNKRC